MYLIGCAVNQTSDKAYYLFDGYAHLAAGLSCGLAGLAAGMAIGIVGDAGVRYSNLSSEDDVIKRSCHLARRMCSGNLGSWDPNMCAKGVVANPGYVVQTPISHGL